MNKTTLKGQHNSLAVKRIFKSSSQLIRCSEKKMMNKQKQFIIHHEVKAFEKKSFWKKDKTFFKAWWVIIGLEKQKGNEERKNKNKFNSMKSCVLFYDSEICQKTPEIFVGNILFIFFLKF